MAPSAEIATDRRIGFGRALAVREDGRSALLYFARKEPNFGFCEKGTQFWLPRRHPIH